MVYSMVPSEQCIKPKVKPFENNIIAKLIKSVYYLGRGNYKACEYGDKNARICEVIDILRYEDDGSLLKKFLKSDEYLKKYLGFDYEAIKHIHSKNDAILIYDGFSGNRVDGGFANSIYRRKNIIDLEGAIEQRVHCEENSDHGSRGKTIDGGKSDSIYKNSNKSDSENSSHCEGKSDNIFKRKVIDGGNSNSIYKYSNIIDLDKNSQCEEGSSDHEFRRKDLDGGKSNSTYKNSDKIDGGDSQSIYKKSNKIDLGKNSHCEEDSSDHGLRKAIDGGDSQSIYKKSNKIDLRNNVRCKKDYEC